MNNLIQNISPKELRKLQVLLSLLDREQSVTKEITLQKFIEEYSAYAKSNLCPKSCEGIKSAFSHLLKFFSSSRELSLITPVEVERFVAQVRTKAPKGYRVYVRTLKASFNKAKDWSYITENPFDKYKLPKRQQNAPAYLTTEEFNRVLEKIEIKVVKDISTICFYTGLRLGEATSLRWCNIDMKNKAITVGDKEFNTKTRSQRVVPMHRAVEQVFIERMTKGQVDGTGFVFPNKKNKSFSTDYISKRFKKACGEAGVGDDIHFHSLRHSAASNLVQKEVPLYTVQKILGHSSINTTQIYAHLKLEDMRDAIYKLS